MKKLLLNIVFRKIMRPLLKLFLGLNAPEINLPKHKPCILVANHNSHLDTISILSMLSAEQIHLLQAVAAADYFGKTSWQAKFSKLFINVLLIPRKRAEKETDPDPFAMMLTALDQGKSLLLFPEGTRGKPEEMQAFKKGIGYLLATRPDVPFLPIFTKGLGESLPKGSGSFVPFLSQIAVGEFQYANSKDPKEIVKQVEEEVIQLGISLETDLVMMKN